VANAKRDAVAGEIINVERTIAAQKAGALAAQAVLAQAETARVQAEDRCVASSRCSKKNMQPPTQWKGPETPETPPVAAVTAAQAQVSAAEFAVQDVAPLQAKLKAAEPSWPSKTAWWAPLSTAASRV
jgi:hypothetical protein